MMVMIEDNPYSGVQRFAAPSDVDSGGGEDRRLEDRNPGTGKTRGRGIVDIGNGLDVGSGHHGREDGGQSAHVSGGGNDRQPQGGDKQNR